MSALSLGAHRGQTGNQKSARVQVSRTELDGLVGMSHARVQGVILLAGLKWSILGGGERNLQGTGAVGFTDLGGLLLNQLLTDGRPLARNSLIC